MKEKTLFIESDFLVNSTISGFADKNLQLFLQLY